MRPHKYDSHTPCVTPRWCDFLVCQYHTAWVSDVARSTSMGNVRASGLQLVSVDGDVAFFQQKNKILKADLADRKSVV